MEILPQFTFHKLNPNGQRKAVAIAETFTRALLELEDLCAGGSDPRLMAIVRSKMEEACFFAKKAMAVQTHNQIEVNKADD